MPLNSRNKGARRELEWRDVLREHGYTAERGQQHAGGADSPDVKHDVPGVHFEVKGVEKPLWTAWFAQAVRDAGGRLPVIAWKRNRTPWLVVMMPADFLNLVERAALADLLRGNNGVASSAEGRNEGRVQRPDAGGISQRAAG